MHGFVYLQTSLSHNNNEMGMKNANMNMEEGDLDVFTYSVWVHILIQVFQVFWISAFIKIYKCVTHTHTQINEG